MPLVGVAFVSLVVLFFILLLVLNALVEMYIEMRTKFTRRRPYRGKNR